MHTIDDRAETCQCVTLYQRPLCDLTIMTWHDVMQWLVNWKSNQIGDRVKLQLVTISMHTFHTQMLNMASHRC